MVGNLQVGEKVQPQCTAVTTQVVAHLVNKHYLWNYHKRQAYRKQCLRMGEHPQNIKNLKQFF